MAEVLELRSSVQPMRGEEVPRVRRLVVRIQEMEAVGRCTVVDGAVRELFSFSINHNHSPPNFL